MGLTVHDDTGRQNHAAWDELTSVDIRYLGGLSGVWLVVTPKLGSALLADKRASKLWAKHDGLPLHRLSRVTGSSQRAIRVALAHYSGGKYQADLDAAGTDRER